MVTLYRGNLENFDENCGHYGIGPFCKNERNENIDALYQWSATSEKQLPKFVSMIFEVPASAFTAAVRSHYRIAGIFRTVGPNEVESSKRSFASKIKNLIISFALLVSLRLAIFWEIQVDN